MRLIYPYNEILPKKKAHDVFIVNECAALANLGWEVDFLFGKGREVDELYTHYNLSKSSTLHLHPFLMIRKNNPLGLSWNFPFFWQCQRFIERKRPDVVLLSVLKQAEYHVRHKVPGVTYVYEAHELAYYPQQKSENFELEKRMLERMDLITVTTESLKEILSSPPYSLKNPVHVIPLAVQADPLPPPKSSPILQLAYVGQLYEGQGIPLLLHALSKTQNVHLTICGGKPQEIAHFKALSEKLKIHEAVTFAGFIPPRSLPSILKNMHAFVAPFESQGRMPYVAHTKLFEYARWGRPFIAPNLPIVREHFGPEKGVLLFEPENVASLAQCIQKLQNKPLQQEISAFANSFTWSSRAQAYAQILKSILK